MLGDKIKIMIEERNITQKKLADDLKMPPSTLGNYLNGIREPDFNTLILIAKYFSVSTDYLLGYSANTEFIINHKEDELLRIFKTISGEQQDLFLEQGKAIIRANNKREVKSSTSLKNKVN